MFPSNSGNPLGEDHGGATYFMFEIHYDNPQLKSCLYLVLVYMMICFNPVVGRHNFIKKIIFFPVVDSSGFRLFYTDNLREYDSSTLLVGQKVSPFHVVPQGMTSFTSMGYCTSECTSQVCGVPIICLHTLIVSKYLTEM